MATLAGDVFVPEWPGGVTAVRPDGRTETWRATLTAIDLRPNGIALAPDGSFVIANLGDDGGIWRLHRSGLLEPVLLEVDGVPVPPANFVTVDEQDRIWISVSTRHVPRQLAWRADVADGFIILIDAAGPRIVADGLCYTNEVRPDPSGEWLYVVETFGRRVSRCVIGAGGVLGPPETVFAIERGFFPDGIAFDEEGGLWVTSLVSNRLVRFHREQIATVLEDVNDGFVADVEQAFASRTMSAEHLGRIPDTLLQQLTSVAFGGPDRRTVYLGTLHASCLYRFRTDVAGAVLPHWDFPAR
ncbi:MAG: SMP-30/gluconolactonase/LRE family protein [Vicinamibacterales bacterium]